MKPAQWWMPAVVVVGAVAGFAVVGRGTTISGDMSLPLDAGVTTTSVAATASTVPPSEPPPVTEPTLSENQASARVVIAYTSAWTDTALADMTAGLTAQGFTVITTTPAQVDAVTTRVRPAPGFDAAGSIVLTFLGLTSDALATGSDETWSALDGDADVLILLGSDLGE